MTLLENIIMKGFDRKKSGQFVIIAAVIIATFTLSLVLSIHQTGLNNQQLNYQPVEELVLGVTSDLDRCLTYALSLATHGYNSTGDEYFAEAAGESFIAKWANSVVAAHSHLGLRMVMRESPLGKTGVDFNIFWGNLTGTSQVFTEYSMDIEAYGFKGWTHNSKKFVWLNIFPNSFVLNPGSTTFEFEVNQGKDEYSTKPVQNLKPELVKVNVIDSSTNETLPRNIKSIEYLGQGKYRVTISPTYYFAQDVLSVTVVTPDENIMVGAYYIPGGEIKWATLYLSQNSQGEPALLPYRVPGRGHIQSNFTQAVKHDEVIATSPPTPSPYLRLAVLVNATLYLDLSQNQSPVNITVTLSFNYNNTTYKIGSGVGPFLGKGPYSFTFNSTQGEYPGETRIIPANSTIILKVEADFMRQPYGRLFLDYGPESPSNIELF